MYTIKMDGQVIYSPALSDEYQIISANLALEVDTAGSLTFMLPPGHMAHDAVQKLKSIITVECDGEEIFRGRAMEEKTDFYNQKEIYCEGDLNFLLDSVQRPYTHKGTARALLETMLAAHNAQVDADKHFTIGDVPIIDSMADLDLESDGYTDTLSAIRALLETTEGYLRTRYANGVRYLDCVTSFGENNGQAIEFGVNMLDLDRQTIAEEICTVLLPIGGILDDGTTVTIASVNDGGDTLENPEAIAQYGRIVKAYTFDQVSDPAELKKLAQEKLDAMAFTQSLTIKAVDMHLTQAEKDMIRLGIQVKLHSLPHGMDMNTMCIAIDLDLLEVDNTVYTFGKPARTQSGSAAMMASKINNNTRTLQNQLKHYTETDYTVSIHAGLLNSHEEFISQAQIELNGINATLLLKAEKTEVEELTKRVSGAEILIDGANASIDLLTKRTETIEGTVSTHATLIAQKADSITLTAVKEDLETALDEQGNLIAQYGTQIKQNADEIALCAKADDVEAMFKVQAGLIEAKADLILLNGYVTMEEFEALEGTVNRLWSSELTVNSLSANNVTAGNGDFDNLQFGTLDGQNSNEFVMSKVNTSDQWVTLGLSITYDSFTYADQSGGLHGITYVKGVSLTTGGSSGVTVLGA